MKPSEAKYAEADTHARRAEELKAEAHQLHLQEQRARPLQERLVYAAYRRCLCGAGMAYDPAGASGGYPMEGQEGSGSVFKGSLGGYWDCSAILLGAANGDVKHEAQLPFAFWDIKSENQPSANGATTRPPS